MVLLVCPGNGPSSLARCADGESPVPTNMALSQHATHSYYNRGQSDTVGLSMRAVRTEIDNALNNVTRRSRVEVRPTGMSG